MEIPVTEIFKHVPLERTARIEVDTGEDTSSSLTLNGSTVTLGRNDDCTVPLDLTNVSRHHAQLTCRGEEYAVEDLNSTNGTSVNGIKISRCVLRNNDVIGIGTARILFLQQKARKK